jgi:hypothetical protein
MKRLLVIAAAVLWSLTALPVSAASSAKAANTRKYSAEHRARMKRHATRKPGSRHARMKRYSAEHKARMNRHRAHVAHQRARHK